MAVYLGQVIFLGVVIYSLSGASWLDGKAFGLSVLAVALIWQVCQVVAFMRLRQPVYDEPADQSASGS
jgi:ATP synthase protein I